MFLSPLLHVPLSFSINMCCSTVLIKIHQQVCNKILNIKPCIGIGQISGTWELLMCEYGRKSMNIGGKILTFKN
jgi:hypothetical protein